MSDSCVASTLGATGVSSRHLFTLQRLESSCSKALEHATDPYQLRMDEQHLEEVQLFENCRIQLRGRDRNSGKKVSKQKKWKKMSWDQGFENHSSAIIKAAFRRRVKCHPAQAEPG